MKRDKIGLLFWGAIGTGKGFLAGCIANALLEQEIPVCMTNFAEALNDLSSNFPEMKVVQVRSSHVRLFYSKLSKQKYAHNTIKYIHNMIRPSYEIAVEDDIIRKNPAKKVLGDYGEPEKKRTALTLNQQKKLLAFVRDHENFAPFPWITSRPIKTTGTAVISIRLCRKSKPEFGCFP